MGNLWGRTVKFAWMARGPPLYIGRTLRPLRLNLTLISLRVVMNTFLRWGLEDPSIGACGPGKSTETVPSIILSYHFAVIIDQHVVFCLYLGGAQWLLLLLLVTIIWIAIAGVDVLSYILVFGLDVVFRVNNFLLLLLNLILRSGDIVCPLWRVIVVEVIVSIIFLNFYGSFLIASCSR